MSNFTLGRTYLVRYAVHTRKNKSEACKRMNDKMDECYSKINWHCLDGTWVIKTMDSIPIIYDKLKDVLHPSDAIIIEEINNNNVFHGKFDVPEPYSLKDEINRS